VKNKLIAALAVMATTTTLLALTAPTASADDTAVTFNLTGGALSVSAQATAPLGNKGASGTTSVSGSLGNTVLTDNRGGVTGWSVGAATTAFNNSVPDDPATTGVDETAAATTTATAVSYASGAATSTGVVTATTAGAKTLTPAGAAVAVMNGTVVVGNNTATWNPTLTVTLPTSSTVGSYRGTITTSVL